MWGKKNITAVKSIDISGFISEAGNPRANKMQTNNIIAFLFCECTERNYKH